MPGSRSLISAPQMPWLGSAQQVATTPPSGRGTGRHDAEPQRTESGTSCTPPSPPWPGCAARPACPACPACPAELVGAFFGRRSESPHAAKQREAAKVVASPRFNSFMRAGRSGGVRSPLGGVERADQVDSIADDQDLTLSGRMPAKFPSQPDQRTRSPRPVAARRKRDLSPVARDGRDSHEAPSGFALGGVRARGAESTRPLVDSTLAVSAESR